MLWMENNGNNGWPLQGTSLNYLPGLPPSFPRCDSATTYRPDICPKPTLKSPNDSWKMRQASGCRKCRWTEALMQVKFNLQLLKATACWSEFFTNGFTRYKYSSKLKRLAIFSCIISIVNLVKEDCGYWVISFVSKVHRCKEIITVKLWDSTRNICLRRWTMICLYSYAFIICKAMPMINDIELNILTETECLFPRCWKMT